MFAAAGAALIRAVRAIVDGDGALAKLVEKADGVLPSLIVESTMVAEWSSLTFTGHRHDIVVRLRAAPDSAAAIGDRLASIVTASAITLPRQIVAEIAVEWLCGDADARVSGAAFRITALTIDA